MTKQEVLDYFQLTKLPQGVQKSNSLCPVLVRRTSGKDDYAIAQKGGIKVDSGYKAAIISILEYYPVLLDSTGQFNRDEAIAFLLTKKQKKETLLKMSEDELKLKLIRFHRKF